MPDLFSDITKAPSDVLQAIVKTLELRAADPQLQSMLESYLSEIELPDPARVLEIGRSRACGCGCDHHLGDPRPQWHLQASMSVVDARGILVPLRDRWRLRS